ncbi:hypothetical protein CRG98_038504 [Punica granatum]|uniref:Malectin domain-containing protein n=1 Tax=Punica granatum TaxID=22663 RepID=A0A2I0IC67_PUNGR|nr:hypothetical protein CRG98_038504 [Punica granatum]
MRKTSVSSSSRYGSVLIFVCLFVSIRVYADDYVPTDMYLLNCGASSMATDSGGREWTPDNNSKFLLATAESTTTEASEQPLSVYTVPFMTARLFPSVFTYSIPLSPGHKFIRLYFYPSTPSKKYPNTFAFVNGIEIVSMPDIYNTVDGQTMIVGTQTPFIVDNTMALEHVYRLNVGGSLILPSQDTGLYRQWDNDSPYIYGAAIGVTETASPNMSIKYPTKMPTYVAPVEEREEKERSDKDRDFRFSEDGWMSFIKHKTRRRRLGRLGQPLTTSGQIESKTYDDWSGKRRCINPLSSVV